MWTTPLLEADLPFDGGYVAGNLTLTLTLSYSSSGGEEVPMGDETVEYTIDGGPRVPFQKIGEHTYQSVIDTTKLTERDHTLTIWVTDAAGNTWYKTETITVDNTIPNITIDELYQNIYGDIDGSWMVNDTNIDKESMKWRYDANDWYTVPWNEDTPGTWGIIMPLTDIGDGQHVFDFYASDLAGNSFMFSQYINLVSPPEPVEDYWYFFTEEGGFEAGTNTSVDDGDIMAAVLDFDGTGPDLNPEIDMIGDEGNNFGIFEPGNYYLWIQPIREGVLGPLTTFPFVVPAPSLEDFQIGDYIITTENPTEGDDIIVTVPIDYSGVLPVDVILDLYDGENLVASEEITVPGSGPEDWSHVDAQCTWEDVPSGEHHLSMCVRSDEFEEAICTEPLDDDPDWVYYIDENDDENDTQYDPDDYIFEPDEEEKKDEPGFTAGILFLCIFIIVSLGYIKNRKKNK